MISINYINPNFDVENLKNNLINKIKSLFTVHSVLLSPHFLSDFLHSPNHQELVLKKEQIRDQLPQEPDSDHPDKIDVLLKLPNGTRLERRFLITDSLEVWLQISHFTFL